MAKKAAFYPDVVDISVQNRRTLLFVSEFVKTLDFAFGVQNKMSRLPPKERVVVVKVLLRAARNKRRWW